MVDNKSARSCSVATNYFLIMGFVSMFFGCCTTNRPTPQSQPNTLPSPDGFDFATVTCSSYLATGNQGDGARWLLSLTAGGTVLEDGHRSMTAEGMTSTFRLIFAEKDRASILLLVVDDEQLKLSVIDQAVETIVRAAAAASPQKHVHLDIYIYSKMLRRNLGLPGLGGGHFKQLPGNLSGSSLPTQTV